MSLREPSAAEPEQDTLVHMPKGLQLGDVIQCTYCGQEHTVTGVTSSNVESVKAMLYVVCRKPKPGKYYVGSIGGASNRGPIVRQV